MSTIPKKLIIALGTIVALQENSKSPEFLNPVNNARWPPALKPIKVMSSAERPLRFISSEIN